MHVRVEGPRPDCGPECEDILRDLPDWFGIESALEQYVRDVGTRPTFLAFVTHDALPPGTPVGFLTLTRHFERAAEMHVLGVRRAFHRRGIGRALFDRALAWLRDEGVEYLQVKTLGPSSDDVNYAATRRFYEAMGFRPLEEIPTLWDERNPCLIMVRRT